MNCGILIIYHSQSGNTLRMAESAARGVQSIEGVTLNFKNAGRATLEDLILCRGLLIGSPEYFGYMAGRIKDFFDRTYTEGRKKKGVFKKPCGVFISAGNDGTGALTQIERICLGYPFKKVLAPVVAKGAVTEEVLAKCKEMGQTIAAGCREGIY